MREMIIRPSSGKQLQALYASGGFADDDAFVITDLAGETPFGGTLCNLGMDYAVQLAPDGTGRSMCGGLDVTSSFGMGKAWYLRDEADGEVWTPFFCPAGEKNDGYSVSYLPGQATVRSLKNKIATELTISTSPDCPCEIWRVRLENRSAQDRTLTFTTYVEISPGMSLETRYVEKQKALVMRRSLDSLGESPLGIPERDLVMFHSSTLVPTFHQTDKTAFIGEGKTLRNPRQVSDERENGAEGQASEAVASMTVEIELPIEGEAEFAFVFGVAKNPDEALHVASQLTKMKLVDEALERARTHWAEACSGLQVKTLDRAFDALVNTWLPYETYASWIAERTGGVCLDPSRVADSLRRLHPLIPSAPALCRRNLLSFVAGASANGTYSNDEESLVTLTPSELLWLAASTAAYVAETGDLSVLEERVGLRDGLTLTLRGHCERAIGLCAQAGEALGDPWVHRLLARTVSLWGTVVGESQVLNEASRKLADRPDYPEQRNMPRRMKYFQTLSPTLADSPLSQSLGNTADGEIGEMCRLHSIISEDILGVRAAREGLTLQPNLPSGWCECSITRRYRQDVYHIHIRRGAAPRKKGVSIVADGEPVLGEALPYSGGGAEHNVDVTIG